ncbi:MAG: SAM-dependent methyltransferase [Bacteroidota bacterium]
MRNTTHRIKFLSIFTKITKKGANSIHLPILQKIKKEVVNKGKLYLIPTPLGEHATHTIPAYVIEKVHELNFFIAERAKTARAFIKTTQPKKPFSELSFSELNKRTTPEELRTFLQPCEQGNDMGLLSEAGCPGVADPGAEVVKMAHEKGIEVIPFVGPSSILMALMASGMNGQSFCFQGYLSAKKPELGKDLKRLEQLSRKFRQTQIFIETPYRNMGMLEVAFKVLSPETQWCVAADISLDSEFILTQKIKTWQKTKLPNLHKRPTIFLMQC